MGGLAGVKSPRLESSGKVITDLTFYSPASGYITEKNALPNMYVQPETKLYTVADLSTVWVYAQVFQHDIGQDQTWRCRADHRRRLPRQDVQRPCRSDSPAGRHEDAHGAGAFGDAQSRAQAEAGYVRQRRAQAPLGRQLVVPASAVLQSGTRQIVFVDHGDGNLEPRQIVTGARVGDEFIVLRGLTPHESIVTSANFLIDSESQLQAAAGAFVPPPPGAGGATSTKRRRKARC